MGTSCGAIPLKDFVPHGDAVAEARLRRASAMLIGKSTTPDAVVKVIHEATLEALKSQAICEKIENQAGRVFTAGPAKLDALVSKDIKALSKIVKERGIKPE